MIGESSVLSGAPFAHSRNTSVPHTRATLGIRRTTMERRKLQRESITVATPWGPVRAKRGWNAAGLTVVSPEYDDCSRVARQHDVPLRTVYQAVQRAAESGAR